MGKWKHPEASASKSLTTRSAALFVCRMNIPSQDTITITHRIRLVPNNKQKTYFRKAIGCARLAYNWGLTEWQRRYKAGERKLTGRKIRNAFNAIRKEQFPFTYEVTKYATMQPFEDLQTAYRKFYQHITKYPKPHKKKDGCGGFYIGADHARLSDTNYSAKHLKGISHNVKGKHQYVRIPNLGYVKMAERLRFNGKIMGVRISQEGENFFASFSVKISAQEYQRTHPQGNTNKHGVVGIDMGFNRMMVLSDGISIVNPRIRRKHQLKITRLSRQLSKRRHAKTKQERLQGVTKSNNYKKLAVRLGREHKHVVNIRRDFTQKLTTILTKSYATIVIEDLNIEGMKQNHCLALSVGDAALYELRRQIEYKSIAKGVRVLVADMFYASSKTCHCCGNKNDRLTLKNRTYVCPHCGTVINRDLNAALNLRGLFTNKVGVDYPELTPADLTALRFQFTLNGIATSKVETGRQQELQHVAAVL